MSNLSEQVASILHRIDKRKFDAAFYTSAIVSLVFGICFYALSKSDARRYFDKGPSNVDTKETLGIVKNNAAASARIESFLNNHDTRSRSDMATILDEIRNQDNVRRSGDASVRGGTTLVPVVPAFPVPPVSRPAANDNLKDQLLKLFDQKIHADKRLLAKHPTLRAEVSEIVLNSPGVGVGRCVVTMSISDDSGSFMIEEPVRGSATTSRLDQLDIAEAACVNAVSNAVNKIR